MTLDTQDIKQIKEVNESVIPKWLVPIILSLASSVLAVGIWAGTISNDVITLKKYQEVNDPERFETGATLREIKAELKYLRADLERTRYQVDVVNKDVKDFRKEINEKLDHIDQ